MAIVYWMLMISLAVVNCDKNNVYQEEGKLRALGPKMPADPPVVVRSATGKRNYNVEPPRHSYDNDNYYNYYNNYDNFNFDSYYRSADHKKKPSLLKSYGVFNNFDNNNIDDLDDIVEHFLNTNADFNFNNNLVSGPHHKPSAFRQQLDSSSSSSTSESSEEDCEANCAADCTRAFRKHTKPSAKYHNVVHPPHAKECNKLCKFHCIVAEAFKATHNSVW